jgi:predicted metalloprotease with PDZ domain
VPNGPGPVRYRYRLEFRRRTADGSTGAGLDSTHLYAVTRSVFVAPDPVAARKTGNRYPAPAVRVLVPDGWHVVVGWPEHDGTYHPVDGDDLLGSTLSAAPDFRVASGWAGGTVWRLSIRGSRYFTDSALASAIDASLTHGAAALGPLSSSAVTYTADLGRKGRMSGSLQGRTSIGLIWEPSEILETSRLHDLFHETLHLWFGGAMSTDRWWVEGVTDYLAARLLSEWRRDPDILATLCWRSLANYRRIEHRARVSMLDETRQGIGGDNTELLVYRKGMLAGLLLDAAIRRSSSGRVTLDSAGRALLASAATAPQRMLGEAELRSVLVGLGGDPVDRLWSRVIAGTEPLEDAEITAALTTVTGQAIPLSPPRSKSGKSLRD